MASCLMFVCSLCRSLEGRQLQYHSREECFSFQFGFNFNFVSWIMILVHGIPYLRPQIVVAQ